MATTLNSYSTTQVTLSASGEGYVITRNGILDIAGAVYAITANQTNQYVFLNGEIDANFIGVFVNTVATGFSLQISASGVINTHTVGVGGTAANVTVTNAGIIESGAVADSNNLGSNNNGVSLVGGGANIVNTGSILSPQNPAVYLGKSGSVLQNNGVISGTYGVAAGDVLNVDASYHGASGRIINTGTIMGSNGGLLLNIDNMAVSNSGTIQSGNVAVDYAVNTFGLYSVVENSGNISGNLAVRLGGQGSLLVNSGTISSPGTPFFGIFLQGEGSSIINTGTISTNVSLAQTATSGLSNSVDNRNGHITGLIQGGPGTDIFLGGADAETVNLAAGTNTFTGGGGADVLTGGSGVDTYIYLNPSDSLMTAADRITNFVSAQDKIDINRADMQQVAIVYSASYSEIYFGHDNSGDYLSRIELTGAASRPVITDLVTSATTFSLYGSEGADTLTGGAGNDYISGGGGNDTIAGGGGADRLFGGAGADTFFYTNVSDSPIAVGQGDTIFDFQTGQDKIHLYFADAGQVGVVYNDSGTTDVYFGKSSSGDYAGHITVMGDRVNGSDLIVSGVINLYGGSANDSLIGGAGNDYISGGAGNDTLVGLGGADVLVGGAGADTFLYTAASDSPTATPDRIVDFQSNVDKLNLYFADGGRVRVTYSVDHNVVQFGNDGSGGYTGLINVYGDHLTAVDIVGSGTVTFG